MNNIRITTLEPQEWRLYRDLRLRALREEPQAFGSTYAENATRPDEFWQQRLEDVQKKNSQWLVFAKTGNDLIGMAGAFAEKEIDTAHITAMYVAAEVRGQGISKLLMQDLLTRIQTNPQIKRIIVDVNPEQEAAYRLYKHSRFEITKKYRMVLGDGKEHEVYQLQMDL